MLPQEIKDSYFKEKVEHYNDLHKGTQHKGSGMLFFANNPDKAKEYFDYCDKIRPILNQKEEELHNKYFKKYKIKFN